MWLPALMIFFQSVLIVNAEFGVPHFKKAHFCQPWACVAKILGLPYILPPQNEYETMLKSLVSQDWHQAVEKAVSTCYTNRTREYINSCIGQELLQCTTDNLIQNCPENRINPNDSCNPIATTVGWNYMFTQSRYKDLENNLPKERRSARWFMRHNFGTKCCDLPELVNSTILSECGFRTFLRFVEIEPKLKAHDDGKHYLSKAKSKDKNGKKIIGGQSNDASNADPFECCDMEDFVLSSWVSECDFKMSWAGHPYASFRVRDQNERPSTTVIPEISTESSINRDIRVVPLSCSQETCIFEKLNVISESGVVDRIAFSKVLDDFTTLHPSWNKAKARVVTQCLNKRTSDYTADCEINELLGCALDVFSENCPYKSKNDVCRHSKRNNIVCQISASKYRPKYRRSVCGLPHLVDSDILNQCGVNFLSKIQYVNETSTPKHKNIWPETAFSCQDSSRSTLCLMNKMGVLNKYNFMDFFKFEDRIRSFTATNREWSKLTEIFMHASRHLVLYEDLCNSPKKLLRVINAMVIFCPFSKRIDTPQCKKLFRDII